jgi:autotransporter-associated beta strand protein
LPTPHRGLQRGPVLAAAVLSAVAGVRAYGANTVSSFTGSDSANPYVLDDATNWSAGTVPTASYDALFNSSTYTSPALPLNLGSSQTFGSLDLINPAGSPTYAIVIQGASTAAATTLTLGGGTDSVAPAPTDVLYVDANSAVTFNSSAATGLLNIALSGAGSTVDVAGTATLNGNLSSGTLIKTGAGTLILGNTGVNGFTGGTIITGGVLQMSTSNALGPSLGANISTGALRLTGSVSSGRQFQISSGSSAIDAAAGVTFNLSLATGLTGTGTLNVNPTSATDTGFVGLYGNDPTFSGNVNVVRGTFGIGQNPATAGFIGAGTTTVTVNAGATLQFYNYLNGNCSNGIILNDPTSALAAASGYNWNLSGIISGSGTLNKTGGGAIKLLASDTYTGGTNVSAGTLYLEPQASGSTPAGTGNISIGAATLELAPASAAYNTANGIVLNDPASAIYVPSGVSAAATGAISGAGTLNKTGAGLLYVNNVGTYTGGINVSAGTFEFTTTSALPSGATITLAAGTTLFYGNTTNGVSLSRSLVLNGTSFASLNVGSGSVTDTYSGAITGTGGFNKIGVYGLYLTNADNTYAGGTNISAGTLRSNVAGGTGAGLVNVFSGATLGGNGSVGAATVSGTITAGSSGSSVGSLTTGLLTFNTANAAIKIDATTAIPTTGTAGSSGTPGTTNDLLILASLNTASGTTTISPLVINGGLTLNQTYSFAVAEIPAANVSSSVQSFAGLIGSSGLAISNSFYFANATFQDTSDPAGDDLLVLNFTAAPEPTSLLLLGMATAPLARRRRRIAAHH